ncbi:LmbE-like protein [Trametopsis cervina]|nr:LmbE-like protein [Trametopsis cervina]
MLTLTRVTTFVVLLALFVRALQVPLQNNVVEFLKGDADANILLLTAHPDDECMFFAPTVLALAAADAGGSPQSKKHNVHSLCLSAGNADGLGDVRRDELSRSLDVLGIEAGRRQLIDHPDLQDDITLKWNKSIITQVLEPYVTQNNITVILTFDTYGISGHPNHKSLPRGVLHFLSVFSETHTTPRPRLFALVSHSMGDKYIGPLAALLAKLDLLVGSLVSTGASGLPVFVAGIGAYRRALSAMMQHRSQLVWFRWLYVSFSRYMWVNEWVELLPADRVAGAA